MIAGTLNIDYLRKWATGMNYALSARSKFQWMPIKGFCVSVLTRTMVRPEAPRLIGSKKIGIVGSMPINCRVISRITSFGIVADFIE